ncbi:hypothetical protein ACC791_36835, partial [Rhizobium ruizarguesonis]
MSINRPAIVDRVMQKNGTVADQFFTQGYAGYSEKVEKVGYDPDACEHLADRLQNFGILDVTARGNVQGQAEALGITGLGQKRLCGGGILTHLL